MTQSRNAFRRATGQPLALEPRMMFDAAAVTTAVDTAHQAEAQNAVAAAVVNTPPTLHADATQATHAVTTADNGGVAVFANAGADTVESGQEFSTLQLTVDSASGKEALVVDGQTIALTAGTGSTSAHHYAYTVTTSGGVTTLTIALNAGDITYAADLQNLVNGIHYTTLDNTVDSGTRTVTLTSLGDMDADFNEATASLSIASTITLTNDTNRAPVLNGSGVPDLAQQLILADLGASREIAYSNDGKYLYAANAAGVIVTFAVDEHGALTSEQVLSGVAGMASITDLTVSADGKSVYASSGSNIVALNVGADGKLSYAATTTGTNGTVINLAISDDGVQLYVTTQYNGLVVYTRDTATGALATSPRQVINEGGLGGGRTRTVVSTGDYVYVVSGTSLVTLERGADGTLTRLLDGTLATAIPAATTTSLGVSADGSLVFLGDGSTIRAYALRDGASGKQLVSLGSTSLAGVSGLTVSADGTHLYATSSNGTLNVYTIGATGTLTLAGTRSDVGAAAALAIAPDGHSVVVAGTAVTRFSDVITYINGSIINIGAGTAVSDANLDLLGAGSGDYNGASFVLQRTGAAAADDIFGFANTTSLILSNGRILKDNVEIATFASNGGTLTITFTATTTKADANAVLHQITYSNSGTHANGTEVTLALTASDGELTSTAMTIALLLTDNTAPTLTATVTANPAYDTAGTQVSLFGNAAINTGEVGQTIREIDLTLGGLATASNEFLIVDGMRIDLSASATGTTVTGFTFTYVRNGDTATLSVTSSAGMSTAVAQTLVNGIAYVNDSPQAVSGIRTVTLEAVRDSGGTANGGVDTRGGLAITSTITVAVNNAPALDIVVEPDAGLFYSDGNLSGFTEYVGNVTLSSDGKTLYVTSSSGPSTTGNFFIRVYVRDTANGALTLLQTFTQGASDDPATTNIEVNGLNGLSTLTVSADGTSVYAAGYATTGSATAYSLVQFSRDTNTGALTYVGLAATQGQVFGDKTASGLNGMVSEIVLSADGKSLYTINGVRPNDVAGSTSEIGFYSRDTATGALTYIGSYVGGSAALGVYLPSGLVISADGTSAYLSNASGSMITIMSRDTTTGMLTYQGLVNAASIASDPRSAVQPTDNRYLQTLEDIIISPDDKYVYVSNNTIGYITVFARQADGSLVFVSAVDNYNTGHTTSLTMREMAMSADGKALYVTTYGGQSVLVFTRNAETGALSFVESIGVGKSVNHLAVSADGLNIYAGASVVSTGLAVLSAKASAIYNGEQPTLIGGQVTIGDVDFDAAGSYAGASVTIVRSGTASATDVFGFQDGNGLTLANGRISLNGTVIADFTLTGGKLTIVFTGSVDKTTANQVLHQVTYANANATAPERIALVVTLSDGTKTVSENLGLVLNHAPVDADPDYAVPGATAGSSYTVTLPAGLFTDADGDALTWSLTGTLPAGLVFDATTRTLAGTLASGSKGTYTFTLTATDSNGASVTHTLTLTVASDPAQTPTVSGDSTRLDDGGTTDGYDASHYINALDGVQDVAGSADGTMVYAVGVNASGVPSISVYSRDSEGRLTLVQAIYGDEVASLANAAELVISPDQKVVYVIGGDSVTVFTRDTNTGMLTALGAFGASAIGATEIVRDVTASGDHVYVTVGNRLLAFRESNGSLALENTYTDGGGMVLGGANSMAVSPDGKFLIVGTSGSGTLASVFRINADGSLGFIAAVRGQNAAQDQFYYTNALALSADGKTLYAISNDGGTATVNVLALDANGVLTAIDTETVSGTAAAVVVSADGTGVFVVGSAISVFGRETDGTLTLRNTYASNANPWGNIGFSGLTSATLSADGHQLYVTGQFGWAQTIAVLDIATPIADFTEGGAAVALLPGGSLSDPQLDAANDYGGASLHVERQDGAVADDAFDFLAGNGLTLSGTQILRSGTAIATFVQSGGALTVTFLSGATRADAQNVLRQIAYTNSSDDPAHAGATPAFRITLDDGDQNTAETSVTVALQGINDPAVVITTPLTPVFNEEGESVSLFKDTTIDTIEADQLVWQVIVTVNAAGANEFIRVDGTLVALQATSGTASTASGVQYMVSVSNGITTLTIYVQNTGVRAAEVVNGLAYANNGTGLAGGTRTVGLAIREYVGDTADTGPQVTTVSQQAVVTLAAPTELNTAPVVTIPDTTPAYTERGNAVLLAPGATISDAQMDRFNGGTGNYNGSTLTVALGAGATSLDKLGFVAGNGLSLEGSTLMKDGVAIGTVVNRGGTITFTFSDAAGTVPTGADVRNTLRQITYASDSHTPAASVDVSVTLADQRGLAAAPLALHIAITAINDAPVVDADPVLSLGELGVVENVTSIPGLGDMTAVALSADGKTAYAADGNGAIALFTRDTASGVLTYVATFAGNGFDAVIKLQVSADGSSLYAVASGGEALAVFHRDATGALTLVQTLLNDQDSSWAVSGVKDIALSADGTSLYLLNGSNLVSFSRDPATGKLSYVDALGDGWSPPYLWQPNTIVVAGDYVFVTTLFGNATLIAYHRAADGSLAPAGYARNGEADADGTTVNLTDPAHLAVSADGSLLYVANGSEIGLFRFDAASGGMRYLGTVASGLAIADIALSANGNGLYVTQADGSVRLYSATGQTLRWVDTLDSGNASGLANAGAIAVGSDGGVLVIGSGLVTLRAPGVAAPVYTVGSDPLPIAPAMALGDAELDAGNGGAGDYGGASLTVKGTSADDVFGFADGSGLSLAGGNIFKGGAIIATFAQTGDTLAISFLAGTTTADAGSVLRQITYGNAAAQAAGTVTVTITFHDGQISSAARQVDVTVRMPDVNHAPTVGAAPADMPAAKAGDAYRFTLPAALFDDADGDALTWRIDGLPDGMQFDPVTRTLSGTPTAAGSSMLTLVATDPEGASVSRTTTLVVQAADAPVTPTEPTEPTEPSTPPSGTQPGTQPDSGTPSAPVTPAPDTSVPSPTPPVALPSGYFDANPGGPRGLDAAGNRDVSAPTTGPDNAQNPQPNAAQSPSGQPWGTAPSSQSEPVTAGRAMDLLNALHARRLAETDADRGDRTPVQLADGSSSPLVSLAGFGPDNAPVLDTTVRGLTGSWTLDAAGNRRVFALPAGLFTSRAVIASVTLRMADGRPLPPGVRLDIRTGMVIAAGLRGDGGKLTLQLVARTVDGATRSMPVTLGGQERGGLHSAIDVTHGIGVRESGNGSATANAANATGSADAPAAGKPALSLQLREGPAHDLMVQARQFLAALTGFGTADSHPQIPSMPDPSHGRTASETVSEDSRSQS